MAVTIPLLTRAEKQIEGKKKGTLRKPSCYGSDTMLQERCVISVYFINEKGLNIYTGRGSKLGKITQIIPKIRLFIVTQIIPTIKPKIRLFTVIYRFITMKNGGNARLFHC
jgi:hypothetical protein